MKYPARHERVTVTALGELRALWGVFARVLSADRTIVRLFVSVISVLLGAAPSSWAQRSPSEDTQRWYSRGYGRDDGLPGNTIFAIAQDQAGYIWLGTVAGLVRFDGVRFALWRDLPGASNAVPAAAPLALCASRDGSLWVGFSGAGAVSRVNGHQVTTYPSTPDLPFGRATRIVEDRSGTIWFATQSGLFAFRENKWEWIGQQHGLPEERINSLFEDREGNLWVGADTGIFRRVSGESRFGLVRSAALANDFVQDAGGTVWFTGPNSALEPVESHRQSAVAAPRGVTGTRLLRDRQDRIWLATQGAGVWQYRPGSSSRLSKQTVELTSEVASTLLEDREGSVWVGTRDGLNRLYQSAISWPGIDVSGLPQPIRTVAATADGSLWIGSNDGLFRLRNGELLRFDTKDGLPSASITALNTDAHGVLWAGSGSKGLAYFDKNRFVSVPLHLGSSVITGLTTDRDGAVWLLDISRGVQVWKNGAILMEGVFSQLARDAVHAVYADHQGRVWIGLHNGAVFVYESGVLRPVEADKAPNSRVIGAFYEDPRGQLWGGANDGLYRFAGDRFVRVSLGRPVEGSDIRWIVEDAETNLWLGTSVGIARIANSELVKVAATPDAVADLLLYGSADGLYGMPVQVSGSLVARTNDGLIWSVTSHGLESVNPAAWKKDRVPPPVRIEAVIADDEVIVPDAASRLRPLTRRLQIDFAALSFAAPSSVTFRYRLEGFDSEWVEAGRRRQAFYTNLRPGAYQFRVVANNDGVWNDVGASWAFTLPPSFYQTMWFQMACLAAIALVAAGVWQYRLRLVRAQFAVVLAERGRVAREIHDTLLQDVVGLKLQIDAVQSAEDRRGNPAGAALTSVGEQLELTIRTARQAIRDLRSFSPTQKDLPTALRLAAESVSRHSQVNCDVAITGTPRRLPSHTEEQLLRIGQEAMANSTRHSEATHVEISLRYEPDAVALSVRDNGRGFDPSTSAFNADDHWGLAIMQERADLMGARFSVVSQPGQGTTVDVVVPAQITIDGLEG